MNPFPGSIGQIYTAKIHNKTPEIQAEFPVLLKDLVYSGWSKELKDRPELEKFRSVFCLMLKREEEKRLTGNNSVTMIGPFIMHVSFLTAEAVLVIAFTPPPPPHDQFLQNLF